MTLVTGTVLPLVLAFGVVVVLLVAGRRSMVRVVPARPLVTLLSIWTGGCAVFVGAMAAYCTAQPHGAARCVRTSVTEGLVLAAVVLAPAAIFTLVASRR